MTNARNISQNNRREEDLIFEALQTTYPDLIGVIQLIDEPAFKAINLVFWEDEKHNFEIIELTSSDVFKFMPEWCEENLKSYTMTHEGHGQHTESFYEGIDVETFDSIWNKLMIAKIKATL